MLDEQFGAVDAADKQWINGSERGRIRLSASIRCGKMMGGEYPWEAGEYGEGQVAVKIVDALDEEWFGVVEGDE